MTWSQTCNGVGVDLVWDGSQEVRIPEAMGVPREDQLRGSPHERLAELGGRACYDSLGKGRGSDDYHKHIVDSGHWSVWEHGNVTFKLSYSPISYLPYLMANRPGLWIRRSRKLMSWIVTLDLRAMYEFDTWTEIVQRDGNDDEGEVIKPRTRMGDSLWLHGQQIAPRIFSRERDLSHDPDHNADELLGALQIVEPSTDHEKWISLFMRGSRGWSHEQVRHGDFTAISQRSTRFVDEHAETWIRHPLLIEYLKGIDRGQNLFDLTMQAEYRGQATYIAIVDELQAWMASQPGRFGTDKTGMRKQARGAARGFLGNALPTSMLFSASVWEWREIIRQRGSIFADAEMREVACCVLPELQKSRYGDRFEEYHLRDSPDGIGQVIVK